MMWSGQICLFLGLKKLLTVNKKNWGFFFRKLKKVWTMLQSAKSELADLQVEQQREMEGLLEVRIIFSGLSVFFVLTEFLLSRLNF